MTLAARRHAKIIDKAKGHATGSRNDGKWNQGKGKGGGGWNQADYGEDAGKGKGRKGNWSGKGGSWTQKQRESWKFRQNNNWQKDTPKADKGKENARKEGTG